APGRRVVISGLGNPGLTFTGKVKAISTATGASLSLMPQDNSAGNFVKVRQRVPVRIEFDADNKPEDMAKLRAGMNVECSVQY
ncbi:MAG: HlyD family secretion protein, partial [Muribaculaceae bacterium]|nr:HlyD family secretion protein [Muribaculaceae bacterium]